MTIDKYQKESLDKMVERNKSQFSGTMVYGVPITELNADQLMATVIEMGVYANRLAEIDKEIDTFSAAYGGRYR